MEGCQTIKCNLGIFEQKILIQVGHLLAISLNEYFFIKSLFEGPPNDIVNDDKTSRLSNA